MFRDLGRVHIASFAVGIVGLVIGIVGIVLAIVFGTAQHTCTPAATVAPVTCPPVITSACNTQLFSIQTGIVGQAWKDIYNDTTNSETQAMIQQIQVNLTQTLNSGLNSQSSQSSPLLRVLADVAGPTSNSTVVKILQLVQNGNGIIALGNGAVSAATNTLPTPDQVKQVIVQDPQQYDNKTVDTNQQMCIYTPPVYTTDSTPTCPPPITPEPLTCPPPSPAPTCPAPSTPSTCPPVTTCPACPPQITNPCNTKLFSVQTGITGLKWDPAYSDPTSPKTTATIAAIQVNLTQALNAGLNTETGGFIHVLGPYYNNSLVEISKLDVNTDGVVIAFGNGAISSAVDPGSIPTQDQVKQVIIQDPQQFVSSTVLTELVCNLTQSTCPPVVVCTTPTPFTSTAPISTSQATQSSMTTGGATSTVAGTSPQVSSGAPSTSQVPAVTTTTQTVPSTSQSPVPTTTVTQPSTAGSTQGVDSTSQSPAPTSTHGVPSTSQSPVPITSTQSVPSTSQSPIPSTSQGVPSTSQSTIAITSTQPIPSTSQSPAPTTTQGVPSTSQSPVPTSTQSIPSTSQPPVPTTSTQSVPSTSQSPVPSTSQQAHSTSQGPVPTPTQPIPSTSQSTVPITSTQTVPGTSQSPVPSTTNTQSVPTSTQSVPSTSQSPQPSTATQGVPSTSQTPIQSTSTESGTSTSQTPVPTSSWSSAPTIGPNQCYYQSNIAVAVELTDPGLPLDIKLQDFITNTLLFYPGNPYQFGDPGTPKTQLALVPYPSPAAFLDQLMNYGQAHDQNTIHTLFVTFGNNLGPGPHNANISQSLDYISTLKYTGVPGFVIIVGNNGTSITSSVASSQRLQRLGFNVITISYQSDADFSPLASSNEFSFPIKSNGDELIVAQTIGQILNSTYCSSPPVTQSTAPVVTSTVPAVSTSTVPVITSTVAGSTSTFPVVTSSTALPVTSSSAPTVTSSSAAPVTSSVAPGTSSTAAVITSSSTASATSSVAPVTSSTASVATSISSAAPGTSSTTNVITSTATSGTSTTAPVQSSSTAAPITTTIAPTSAYYKADVAVAFELVNSNSQVDKDIQNFISNTLFFYPGNPYQLGKDTDDKTLLSLIPYPTNDTLEILMSYGATQSSTQISNAIDLFSSLITGQQTPTISDAFNILRTTVSSSAPPGRDPGFVILIGNDASKVNDAVDSANALKNLGYKIITVAYNSDGSFDALGSQPNYNFQITQDSDQNLIAAQIGTILNNSLANGGTTMSPGTVVTTLESSTVTGGSFSTSGTTPTTVPSISSSTLGMTSTMVQQSTSQPTVSSSAASTMTPALTSTIGSTVTVTSGSSSTGGSTVTIPSVSSSTIGSTVTVPSVSSSTIGSTVTNPLASSSTMGLTVTIPSVSSSTTGYSTSASTLGSTVTTPSSSSSTVVSSTVVTSTIGTTTSAICPNQATVFQGQVGVIFELLPSAMSSNQAAINAFIETILLNTNSYGLAVDNLTGENRTLLTAIPYPTTENYNVLGYGSARSQDQFRGQVDAFNTVVRTPDNQAGLSDALVYVTSNLPANNIPSALIIVGNNGKFLDQPAIPLAETLKETFTIFTVEVGDSPVDLSPLSSGDGYHFVGATQQIADQIGQTLSASNPAVYCPPPVPSTLSPSPSTVVQSSTVPITSTVTSTTTVTTQRPTVGPCQCTGRWVYNGDLAIAFELIKSSPDSQSIVNFLENTLLKNPDSYGLTPDVNQNRPSNLNLIPYPGTNQYPSLPSIESAQQITDYIDVYNSLPINVGSDPTISDAFSYIQANPGPSAVKSILLVGANSTDVQSTVALASQLKAAGYFVITVAQTSPATDFSPLASGANYALHIGDGKDDDVAAQIASILLEHSFTCYDDGSFTPIPVTRCPGTQGTTVSGTTVTQIPVASTSTVGNTATSAVSSTTVPSGSTMTQPGSTSTIANTASTTQAPTSTVANTGSSTVGSTVTQSGSTSQAPASSSTTANIGSTTIGTTVTQPGSTSTIVNTGSTTVASVSSSTAANTGSTATQAGSTSTANTGSTTVGSTVTQPGSTSTVINTASTTPASASSSTAANTGSTTVGSTGSTAANTGSTTIGSTGGSTSTVTPGTTGGSTTIGTTVTQAGSTSTIVNTASTTVASVSSSTVANTGSTATQAGSSSTAVNTASTTIGSTVTLQTSTSAVTGSTTIQSTSSPIPACDNPYSGQIAVVFELNGVQDVVKEDVFNFVRNNLYNSVNYNFSTVTQAISVPYPGTDNYATTIQRFGDSKSLTELQTNLDDLWTNGQITTTPTISDGLQFLLENDPNGNILIIVGNHNDDNSALTNGFLEPLRQNYKVLSVAVGANHGNLASLADKPEWYFQVGDTNGQMVADQISSILCHL